MQKHDIATPVRDEHLHSSVTRFAAKRVLLQCQKLELRLRVAPDAYLSMTAVAPLPSITFLHAIPSCCAPLSTLRFRQPATHLAPRSIGSGSFTLAPRAVVYFRKPSSTRSRAAVSSPASR